MYSFLRHSSDCSFPFPSLSLLLLPRPLSLLISLQSLSSYTFNPLVRLLRPISLPPSSVSPSLERETLPFLVNSSFQSYSMDESSLFSREKLVVIYLSSIYFVVFSLHYPSREKSSSNEDFFSPNVLFRQLSVSLFHEFLIISIVRQEHPECSRVFPFVSSLYGDHSLFWSLLVNSLSVVTRDQREKRAKGGTNRLLQHPTVFAYFDRLFLLLIIFE